MVSFSASAVQAEALICSALRPWLIAARGPVDAGQVGRQAVVVAGVDQQRHLAIQQVGHVGHGVFHAVHREGDVAAIEMAAVQDASLSASMIGLSLALLSSFSIELRNQAAHRPARR